MTPKAARMIINDLGDALDSHVFVPTPADSPRSGAGMDQLVTPSKLIEKQHRRGERILDLPFLLEKDLAPSDDHHSLSSSSSYDSLDITIPEEEVELRGHSNCSDRLRMSFQNHFVSSESGFETGLDNLDTISSKPKLYRSGPEGQSIRFSIRRSWVEERHSEVSEPRSEEVPVGFFLSFCNADRAIRRPHSPDVAKKGETKLHHAKHTTTIEHALDSSYLNTRYDGQNHNRKQEQHSKHANSSPGARHQCKRRVAALKRLQMSCWQKPE